MGTVITRTHPNSCMDICAGGLFHITCMDVLLKQIDGISYLSQVAISYCKHPIVGKFANYSHPQKWVTMTIEANILCSLLGMYN